MKDVNILYQIKTLEGLIFRNFFSNVIRDNDITLTPTQMRILQYILESESDVYQNTLEKTFNLRRATISGVLQTMEKNNLINRVTSEKDTRTKKIIPSNKAKEVFNCNKEKLKNIENIIIKDITADEIKIFCSIINKMKKNAKNL